MKIKTIIVDMPDGMTYRIDAKPLAEMRAKYYAEIDAKDGEGTFEELYEKELEYSLEDWSELLDYITGNMNWKDVVPYVISSTPTVKHVPTEREMNEGWYNSDNMRYTSE